MRLASLRGRSRIFTTLAPPALLFALLAQPSCASRDPRAVLETAFGAHAAEVLGARRERGFVETTGGFRFEGAAPGSLALDLPALGDGAIVLDGITVHEVGGGGDARAINRSVVYARPGVASFWTAGEDGAEEWLLLDDAGPAKLAWLVEGAELRQRGEAVEIVDERGRVRFTVMAPAAYAEDGGLVGLHLRAEGHTIALAIDAHRGRVLVDPTWQLTAPMNFTRYQHTATLLQSGNVLVAGGGTTGGGGAAGVTAPHGTPRGVGAPSVLSDAETYDVALDQWNIVSPMLLARQNHDATLLPNGTVLVAGGDDGGGFNSFAEAEVYDPMADQWTTTQSMLNPRTYFTMTDLTATGTVLVAGGFTGGSGGPTSAVEIYDPNLMGGSWLPADPMFSAREAHTATTLDDGTILVAGGEAFNAQLNSFEVYDPASGHWSISKNVMADARSYHTATKLPNGQVLVAGGTSQNDTVTLDTAELYDPMTGAFTPTGKLLGPRTHATAKTLVDGTAIVIGGYDAQGAPLDTTEIYDPALGIWKQGPQMNNPRAVFAGVGLKTPDFLVTGGDDFGAIPFTEILHFGCVIDADCNDLKLFCAQGGACTPKKVNGIPAVTGNECQSGIVADNVCCDSLCNLGPCDACSVAAGAKVDGTCAFTKAACDDGDACTLNDHCKGGVCVGAKKSCPAKGVCYEDNGCDPTSGSCADVPKPDGSPCDDSNSCTVDGCVAGQCVGVNVLDGTPCPGGVCIAGTCVLDPVIGAGGGGGASTTSSSATTTTSTSGATTGSGAGGNAQGDTGDNPRFEGGGCLAIAPAKPSSNNLAIGLAACAVGIAVARKKRRV